MFRYFSSGSLMRLKRLICLLGAKSSMSDKVKIPKELAAQIEYEQGMEMSRNHMKIRRGDMIFFTAVQGSILSIIGNNIISMDPKAYALSFLAFLVSFVGFNNERRLKIHGDGYLKRVREVDSHGLTPVALKI